MTRRVTFFFNYSDSGGPGLEEKQGNEFLR